MAFSILASDRWVEDDGERLGDGVAEHFQYPRLGSLG